ncbi:hypothetical protein TrCOL_g9476 [Triparma columacea]|uniref:PUB domain-containing protein n=1 Tax=Triparma columacea TaxID=722753 RepID=A0A9W7L404_9STRA|nr:hypothetical protein TrCOL_g9476 [Triparma columacea]
MESPSSDLDRSYRLLTSQNIPQSTSQRVVFLRLKGVPDEIIESALAKIREDRGLDRGGMLEEENKDDWIDRWGHAIAGFVGTVVGVSLVKGVRWLNGDDSNLFGEVKGEEGEEEEEGKDVLDGERGELGMGGEDIAGEEGEHVGTSNNADVNTLSEQAEMDIVEGLIPDDDDENEDGQSYYGGASEGGANQEDSAGIKNSVPLPPMPPLKEATTEEREERRALANSAMKSLRRKQEEKKGGEEVAGQEGREGEGEGAARKEEKLGEEEINTDTDTDTATTAATHVNPNFPLPSPASLKEILAPASSYTPSRLRLLKLFVSNILRFPTSPAYTTIPTTSSQFRAQLGKDDVGGKALRAFGFLEIEGKYVWKGEEERLKVVVDVIKEIENERKTEA